MTSEERDWRVMVTAALGLLLRKADQPALAAELEDCYGRLVEAEDREAVESTW